MRTTDSRTAVWYKYNSRVTCVHVYQELTYTREGISIWQQAHPRTACRISRGFFCQYSSRNLLWSSSPNPSHTSALTTTVSSAALTTVVARCRPTPHAAPGLQVPTAVCGARGSNAVCTTKARDSYANMDSECTSTAHGKEIHAECILSGGSWPQPCHKSVLPSFCVIMLHFNPLVKTPCKTKHNLGPLLVFSNHTSYDIMLV